MTFKSGENEAIGQSKDDPERWQARRKVEIVPGVLWGEGFTPVVSVG